MFIEDLVQYFRRITSSRKTIPIASFSHIERFMKSTFKILTENEDVSSFSQFSWRNKENAIIRVRAIFSI